MKCYFDLIRIHQWIKNLFVFLPVFFSGKLFNQDLLVLATIVFFLFSFTASSIYILNDYKDIESDKLHPEKKNRPLANGSIKKSTAIGIFFILILLTTLLLIFYANKSVIVVMLSYFFMNVAYSLGLKHIAIIDILIISIGFVLRVLAGGFMTEIPVTDWTALLTFSLALILAIGKRRGEMMNSEISGKSRKSLDGYNIKFLDNALTISCVITIVCYVMYTLTPETQNRIHHLVFYTFVFVIIGILRYLQKTFVFNTTESPTKLIFKDRFLQIILLLWGLSFLLLIYFK